MTTVVNGLGQVVKPKRTRRKHVLPAKVEAAYQESEGKRTNKTSRLDYGAGYEDGYNDALDDLRRGIQGLTVNLRKNLKAP